MRSSTFLMTSAGFPAATTPSGIDFTSIGTVSIENLDHIPGSSTNETPFLVGGRVEWVRRVPASQYAPRPCAMTGIVWAISRKSLRRVP